MLNHQLSMEIKVETTRAIMLETTEPHEQFSLKKKR